MAASDVKDAAEILEEAADVVEDTLDLVEAKVSWLAKNPKATALIAGTTGALFGALACFLVVNSRLKLKYQRIANEEIASVKEKYTLLNKEGEEHSLDALAAKVDEDAEERQAEIEQVASLVEREGYVHYEKVAPTVEAPANSGVITAEETHTKVEVFGHNIFESDDPDRYFNMDEELARRRDRPELPYVITQDEFDENDPEYEQTRMTYFEGDDVLTAADESVIPDIEGTIGAENLLRFGHGSKDPMTVHIRNERLGLDIELTHSTGKYTTEVLRLSEEPPNELKHSHQRRSRRGRDFDE